jgi:2-oxo-4-hydroxy-4-carboxy-5-ureidoimidazoline decarboxylase
MAGMISDHAPYRALFEHSPWVVDRAFAAAPFATPEALHARLMQVVADAAPAEQLALIRAHPELAARSATLTAASAAEQAGAQLRALPPAEYEHFARLNAAYRERFGFPYIVCVRLHSKAGIVADFAARLCHDEATERRRALDEIGRIAWLRLTDMAAT